MTDIEEEYVPLKPMSAEAKSLADANLKLAYWIGHRLHEVFPTVDEHECLSFVSFYLCSLAVSYKPNTKRTFTQYFSDLVRKRFVDYLRDNGPYRRVTKNKETKTLKVFELVYKVYDEAIYNTPETLLIVHETAYLRSLKRNSNGTLTRDALNYARSML